MAASFPCSEGRPRRPASPNRIEERIPNGKSQIEDGKNPIVLTICHFPFAPGFFSGRLKVQHDA